MQIVVTCAFAIPRNSCFEAAFFPLIAAPGLPENDSISARVSQPCALGQSRDSDGPRSVRK